MEKASLIPGLEIEFEVAISLCKYGTPSQSLCDSSPQGRAFY